MIFAKYNYKNYHFDIKDKWPIKPTNNGIDRYNECWSVMVRKEVGYCKKFNWFKWLKLYVYKHIGRLKYYSDLNSFHPYWQIEVKKGRKKMLKELIRKYEVCKKDPGQIKYLFNANTGLNMIEKMIEELRQKINSK